MGSKNKIAADLVNILPEGPVFVDLFAGGCAMTHAALWSGKWPRVIANDIQRQFPDLFFRAATGRLTDCDRRAVDRDEFSRVKDHDAAVALLWSFGNKGECYLWSADLEPVKLAAFRMIMSENRKDRLVWFKKFIQGLRDARAELKMRKEQRASILNQIDNIEEWLRGELCAALKASEKTQAEVNRHLGTQMAGHYFGSSQWAFPTREEFEKLREILPTLHPFDYYGQHLERLERLESDVSLDKKLTISGKDYAEITIPEGSVVYADPPYEGMAGYKGTPFNHERFWEWCRTRDFPVFISEYKAPSDFVPIWEKAKTCHFAANNNAKQTIEKLFVHQRFN